jgi:hypothetical protein
MGVAAFALFMIAIMAIAIRSSLDWPVLRSLFSPLQGSFSRTSLSSPPSSSVQERRGCLSFFAIPILARLILVHGS